MLTSILILAKGLTLEQIDLLWADQDFKDSHQDLAILHGVSPAHEKEMSVSDVEVGKQ